MDREQAIVKAYSLYPRQIDQIRGYAIAMTDKNESAALRRIVDEWLQMKQSRITAPRPTES